MTLEYAVAASAIAQGWAGYFVNFLETVAPGAWIPPQLFNYPFVWGLTCRFVSTNRITLTHSLAL